MKLVRSEKKLVPCKYLKEKYQFYISHFKIITISSVLSNIIPELLYFLMREKF